MSTNFSIISIFATICPVATVVACAALILIATVWIVDMYCSYYDYIYSGDLDSYNDTSNMAMQLYMLGDMELAMSQFIFAHYAAPYLGKKETSNQTFNILAGKTLTNQTGKVDNYVSGVKGESAARADFEAMAPTNIRTYSNGTIVGALPDGRTINLHPSTTLGGTPSVEIYDPVIRKSIKIRY